jgi:hypothetical protein
MFCAAFTAQADVFRRIELEALVSQCIRMQDKSDTLPPGGDRETGAFGQLASHMQGTPDA